MFSRKEWRLEVLFFIVLLLFFLVFVRLFKIQILDHEKYAVLAEAQHGVSFFLPAARGKIYSQDGFPLVSNQPSYLLYGEPSRIDFSKAGSKEVARKLLEILMEGGECPVVNFSADKEFDSYQLRRACESELVRRFSFGRQWVPLVRGVSPEQKEKIESLGFSGIGFEPTPVRFYPEGTLAAHVLGFVGSDEKGKPQGYYGLEGFYDGDLRGSPGLILEERSASGKPILVGKYKRRSPIEGRDLVLTLDRAVQFMVEEKLREGVKKFGAESGTVIVMDPETGGILALANFPTYDPAEPVKEEDQPQALEGTGGMKESGEMGEELVRVERRNLAIASSYEPGSVLKAITMAAGIDSGKITPQTKFHSQPLKVGGHVIRTWDNKYYGEETMTEVLKHSDNTGAAWVALEKLGKRRLRDYFLKFGFGEKTGIDLEGEASGIIKPLSEWRDIDLANASFGQGISLTPLQITNAFAAIANRGLLMRPFLVKEIRSKDRVISLRPQKVRRVVSEQTSEIVTAMLTKAAAHGEARFFVLRDWEVAGKTGTAQIPVGGRYDPHKTNATFVGFLPKSRRFVMLVKLEKPSTSIYAAETAVPLWMEIAKDLIAYYGIPPDK